MTISRADAALRLRERQQRELSEKAGSRHVEFVLLVCACIVIATGLGLVYTAKGATARSAPERMLNLNETRAYHELLPLLRFLPNPGDREFAARKIFAATRRGRHLPNVGAIGRIRLTEAEIAADRRLEHFARRIGQARRVNGVKSIPLFTGAQLAELKPQVSVRDLGEFRNRFIVWTALFFVSFFGAHFLWRMRGFSGDNVLLPVACLLTGLGLMLMVTLRDPLRDSLTFVDFAQGVVAGCVAMVAFSLVNYERHIGRLSYVPLFAALFLALAVGLFGTGPGLSDAKVNLWFFQPIELIRILLVLFLAGYFAQNWDALRELRQQHGSLARRFHVPRLDYLLPVVIGVAAALVLFFWLGDLGPALVIGCLFLALYSIARARAALAAAGLGVIVLGFWAGHMLGKPQTAAQRVDMWLAPWDNDVRGGDQVADGLWALATGGITGTGPGLGSPGVVPAAHTDLIISALGEEAGFLGILALYALYSLLIYRSMHIALRAPGVYSFFLALGLALITALQILLISGGLLGLIPLSGVVSPFLSYGRTSMVTNFMLLGMCSPCRA